MVTSLIFFLSLIFDALSIFLGNAKARAGIREVHFLPFNPTDKRTALTYIDREGKMHRVSKGAPEQVKLEFYASSTVLQFSHVWINLTVLPPFMWFSDPKLCTQ